MFYVEILMNWKILHKNKCLYNNNKRGCGGVYLFCCVPCFSLRLFFLFVQVLFSLCKWQFQSYCRDLLKNNSLFPTFRYQESVKLCKSGILFLSTFQLYISLIFHKIIENLILIKSNRSFNCSNFNGCMMIL